jgi:hypothetical protein
MGGEESTGSREEDGGCGDGGQKDGGTTGDQDRE